MKKDVELFWGYMNDFVNKPPKLKFKVVNTKGRKGRKTSFDKSSAAGGGGAP